MDRVPDCRSGGCGFKSHRPRQHLMPYLMHDGDRKFLTFYDIETGENLSFDWTRPGKLSSYWPQLLLTAIYRNLGKPPKEPR